MKKFAIIIALMLLQAQVMSVSATQTKKTSATTNAAVQKYYSRQSGQTTTAKKVDSKDYLLKYNTNDLDVAPWLHGGKRQI